MKILQNDKSTLRSCLIPMKVLFIKAYFKEIAKEGFY